MKTLLALFVVSLLAACGPGVRPDSVLDGSVACTADSQCPAGEVCDFSGLCERPGSDAGPDAGAYARCDIQGADASCGTVEPYWCQYPSYATCQSTPSCIDGVQPLSCAFSVDAGFCKVVGVDGAWCTPQAPNWISGTGCNISTECPDGAVCGSCDLDGG